MKKTSWVVTANAGVARIFSREGASGKLASIRDIANSDAQLNTIDTESDKIGQHAASKSKHSVGAPTQPSGYQPHQSPAEHKTELFARNVASFLLKGYQEQQFQQLVIAASPEFLGVLRKLLDPTLSAIIIQEINKDYTHASLAELQQHTSMKAA